MAQYSRSCPSTQGSALSGPHEPNQHMSSVAVSSVAVVRVAPPQIRVNCDFDSKATLNVTCGNVFKTRWRWARVPELIVCVGCSGG